MNTMHIQALLHFRSLTAHIIIIIACKIMSRLLQRSLGGGTQLCYGYAYAAVMCYVPVIKLLLLVVKYAFGCIYICVYVCMVFCSKALLMS